jgi:hypothetical protein
MPPSSAIGAIVLNGQIFGVRDFSSPEARGIQLPIMRIQTSTHIWKLPKAGAV